MKCLSGSFGHWLHCNSIQWLIVPSYRVALLNFWYNLYSVDRQVQINDISHFQKLNNELNNVFYNPLVCVNLGSLFTLAVWALCGSQGLVLTEKAATPILSLSSHLMYGLIPKFTENSNYIPAWPILIKAYQRHCCAHSHSMSVSWAT